MPKGSDPMQKFLEIEDHAELMRDAGIQVDVQSVYGIYVAALPSEYELEIRELNRNQVMDRNEIINLVQAQYDLRGKKKKSSPAAHALVVDGRGRPGGRGHPGGKRGGRGGGSGHNGNRKVKKSSDGNDGAEDDKQSATGSMCYNCRGRGHFARDCTVNLCKRCHGKGHEEDKCPSPADMKAHLTIELPNSDAGSTTSNVVAAVLSGGNFNGSSC